MFNKQLKINIKNIDAQIGLLNAELLVTTDDAKYELTLQKIEELTKIRCQLADSKVKDSNKEAVISGIFGIVGVLVVLNYEKTDIVTSKAFGMASKMFKGV